MLIQVRGLGIMLIQVWSLRDIGFRDQGLCLLRVRV